MLEEADTSQFNSRAWGQYRDTPRCNLLHSRTLPLPLGNTDRYPAGVATQALSHSLTGSVQAVAGWKALFLPSALRPLSINGRSPIDLASTAIDILHLLYNAAAADPRTIYCAFLAHFYVFVPGTCCLT